MTGIQPCGSSVHAQAVRLGISLLPKSITSQYCIQRQRYPTTPSNTPISLISPYTRTNSCLKMGLVGYSDSDESDVEQTNVTKQPITSTTSGMRLLTIFESLVAVLTSVPIGKQAFQKVVDRSNPGKIKVSLPALTKDAGDEPSAKRIKTGGGGLSGFNSFLPAPKRTGVTANTSLGGGIKKGLGAGVNLKTGAGPGFSREPEPAGESYNDDTEIPASNAESGLSVSEPKLAQDEQQKPAELKFVGKATMFRPLSVSRKPIKKKKASAVISSSAAAIPATPPTIDKSATRPRISMFSFAPDTSAPAIPASTGEYEPMILQSKSEVKERDENGYFSTSDEEFTPNVSHRAPPAAPTPPVSQSLDDIAGDLRLTAAERRQLFGRGKGAQSATKVINFNTDQEYLHNEEIRAAGETVTHNPVRAIAPGKHSLKQLVNVAQTQKDALEESFARGKSNRSEAASRYGW